jgi:Fe-S-cluster containining protein
MKACEICSKKCMGFDGYDGSCCTVEDRDFIIGPHNDPYLFLERLKNKYDQEFSFEDVFYTYEEGKEIFPDKPVWQRPQSYPALKVNLEHPRKPCIFYNTTLKVCTVHEIRPNTCRTFKCDYLKDNA